MVPPRDDPPADDDRSDRSVGAPDDGGPARGRDDRPTGETGDDGASRDSAGTDGDPLRPGDETPGDGRREAGRPNGGSEAAGPGESTAARVSEYSTSLGEEGSEPLGATDDEEDDVGWREFLYDVVSSVVAVLLVGALLFAISGVWPPMVAIESPSMTPHMQTGDLVFVMDEARFPADGAQEGTGVVTARAGTEVGYEKFQNPGDVIVYEPNGNAGQTPIIHRAQFWVEKDENWYDEADQSHVGSADDCEELRYCPAPHAGFITKGDANSHYDQVGSSAFSSPVKPEWVIGTAEVRIPKLGWIRLRSGQGGVFGASTGNGGIADASTGNGTVSAQNATTANASAPPTAAEATSATAATATNATSPTNATAAPNRTRAGA